jgi:hypothetical protein
MIDAVFVDIDRDNKNPHKKFDNEITEDEFCAKLATVCPCVPSPPLHTPH